MEATKRIELNDDRTVQLSRKVKMKKFTIRNVSFYLGILRKFIYRR